MPQVNTRAKVSPAVRKLIRSCLKYDPRLANCYLRTLEHWLAHKGQEWTANRLKALWQVALLIRSEGMSANVASVLAQNRVKVCRKTGLPAGIEGILVHSFATARRPSVLRRISTVLRSYTAIRLKTLSKQQLTKARTSICSSDESEPSYRKLRISRKRVIAQQPSCDWWLLERSIPNDRSGSSPLVGLLPFNADRQRSGSKRLLRFHSLANLSGLSHYPGLLKIPSSEIEDTPYLSMTASLLTKGRVPQVLVDSLGDFDLRRFAAQYQLKAGDPTFGRISTIQEAGAKARVVCSPNAWIQFYCKPYHEYLSQIVREAEYLCDLKRVPTLLESLKKENAPVAKQAITPYLGGCSCAYDQLRGVSLALDRLNAGSYAACVDLSSATDRFPLWYQIAVTQALDIPEFGAALEELRGPYHGLDGRLWSYAKGQPMGLLGSFPLFHLSHFSLLNGLSFYCNLPNDASNFAVLGDDVIIFNEKLLTTYLEILQDFQVPVSWHKSYRGDLVEFAGFLVTRSRGSKWTAYRPYKHAVKGLSSILNVLHAVGTPASHWSKFWLEAYTVYAETLDLRNLALEPLINDDDSEAYASGLPGTRWFGSCVNKAAYRLSPSYLPETDLMEVWRRERSDLLITSDHEDMQQMGGLKSIQFVPTDYAARERARKRASSPFLGFSMDPLVQSYRKQATEEALLGN